VSAELKRTPFFGDFSHWVDASSDLRKINRKRREDQSNIN